jgi:hypothetical protein
MLFFIALDSYILTNLGMSRLSDRCWGGCWGSVMYILKKGEWINGSGFVLSNMILIRTWYRRKKTNKPVSVFVTATNSSLSQHRIHHHTFIRSVIRLWSWYELDIDERRQINWLACLWQRRIRRCHNINYIETWGTILLLLRDSPMLSQRGRLLYTPFALEKKRKKYIYIYSLSITRSYNFAHSDRPCRNP